MVVILLSCAGKVFLIFRSDIILYSLIACVATFGLLPLAAKHLACAQLCAEAHSDGRHIVTCYVEEKGEESAVKAVTLCI
jgi:hypothetical protein